jgi:hypothetical protein
MSIILVLAHTNVANFDINHTIPLSGLSQRILESANIHWCQLTRSNNNQMDLLRMLEIYSLSYFLYPYVKFDSVHMMLSLIDIFI